MLEDEQPLEEKENGEKPQASPAARGRRRRRLDRMSIGLAALMALGAGGLYFMHARTARGVAIVSSANSNAAMVQTLLAGGREGLTKLSTDIARTRETIDGISHRETVTLASALPLARDPFVFDLSDSSSLPQGDDASAAREAARARALDAARKLQLQSILYGSTRRSCLVDGKLYFEGQPLGEFTVGRIATDAVTLQSGEFKFELRLRK